MCCLHLRSPFRICKQLVQFQFEISTFQSHRPVRHPLDGMYLLRVSIQEHNASASAQVPHSAIAVESACESDRAVCLEGDVEDGLGMALLNEQLFRCLHIEKTPPGVETGRIWLSWMEEWGRNKGFLKKRKKYWQDTVSCQIRTLAK